MIHNPFKIFAFTLIAFGIAVPFFFAAYRGLFSPAAPAPTAGSNRTLLRSQDGGLTWQRAGLSEEQSVAFPRRISDIAFDPQNPNRIFLGSRGAGLWKSDTAGVSWKKVRDSAGALRDNADVFAIAPSPAEPGRMYLAAFQDSFGKIFESSDEGTTFREIFSLTEERFGIFDVWAHPTDANQILAITGQGGVFASNNGGRSWRIFEWLGQELEELAVNPARISEMFIRTRRGELFRSADGGENWRDVTAAIANSEQRALNASFGPSLRTLFSRSSGSVASFFFDSSVPGRLWAIRSGRLVMSSDGGSAWREVAVPIDPGADPLSAASVDPAKPERIIAAQGSILYRSEDNGATWKTSLLGSSERVSKIVPHPSLPDVFFAVTGK
ncbi:MAG: hypothetical protein HY472_00365 [Candidatus Sungbacteria bacterium]|nr:hypothetical protein [Candidatus Sungbacteria bacterium]